MRYAVILFSVLLIFFSFPQAKLFGENAPDSASAHSYSVRISHSQCRLWLFKQNNGKLQFVREYRAGTVKKGLKKYPLGEGYVTKIDFAPVWNPTAYSRWYFAKKLGINLPATVPFGHKLNYMGQFRISLSHNVPGKGPIYRIHGVRPGEEKYVGTRVSGGCIRMRNEEGLELARRISVGTPVEIVY